ncbi:hypothetical protein [Thalassospira lucentensis]|uniref:hypothetical protein n=1 Tax=Thalassospira lucentensis TaxID=168935 RepID=UPI0003B7323E|nr:hypothetical protein [Thalassospira lucentensis]RCK29391.1 hypothetical protein TH1_05465 [Thalassospira lucentensis MCCC 1A00383 = DSM 14000]
MSLQKESNTALARLGSAGILMSLACVLYVGFVVTLFAGFTADIQRDMLSREIATSAPGDLERMIRQSFYEAELHEEIKQLQSDIRKTNTAALEKFRIGLTLRKDAMAAFWQAYDGAAALSTTVTQNRATFEDDFVAAYLDAMTMAHDFVARFQAQKQSPSSDQNPLSDENKDDTQTSGGLHADNGARVVAALRAALAKLAFAGATGDIGLTVVSTFEQGVYDTVDQLGNTFRHFDDQNIQSRVVWENIRAEQRQVDKILRNMQAQIDEIEAELAQSKTKKEIDLSALVALFQNPIGGFLSILVQLPTIMLTLLVTVAAGGLGAVVAFTRQNFGHRSKETQPNTDPGPPQPGSDQPSSDQPDPAAHAPLTPHTPFDTAPDDTAYGLMASARLLMMTGEGIAAAIAIFLFSEAGMLMLTQGGPNGSGQVDISPYLVTFMAFVSGFMAKDAFSKIQDAGHKIFKIRDNDDASGMGL